MSTSAELDRLLSHPVIWRGAQAAPRAVTPTGFTALDACLPGGGWLLCGLIELLYEHPGVGEISLLLPALRSLLNRPLSRWCAWVAPAGRPGQGEILEPYAPALAAAGLPLDRLLVIRPEASQRGAPLWAFEQALASGACEAVLGWQITPRMPQLRRLQLAAEKGRALGVLFRDTRAAEAASAASLRILLTRTDTHTRLSFLKSRGGFRGTLDLDLVAGCHCKGALEPAPDP